jgi:hypothetical protein
VGVDSTPEEATMAPPREPDTATASSKSVHNARRVNPVHGCLSHTNTTRRSQPPQTTHHRRSVGFASRKRVGHEKPPEGIIERRKTLPEAENIRGGERAAHIISVG